MKERPILFSGPLVRAILEGRKTQTRRVIKPRHLFAAKVAHLLSEQSGVPATVTDSPYGQPGDRLWVRESFAPPLCIPCEAGVIAPCVCRDPAGVAYRADGGTGPWRPSIYMPRWASRIDLEVTGVRIERAQDISGEDARAEGIEVPRCNCEVCSTTAAICPADAASYVEAFRSLWDEINGPRGFGWEANPWVWVVEFRRVRP